MCFFVEWLPQSGRKRSKHVTGLPHVYIAYLITLQLLVYNWGLVKNTVINLHFMAQDEENMSNFNAWQLAKYEPAQCTFFHYGPFSTYVFVAPQIGARHCGSISYNGRGCT